MAYLERDRVPSARPITAKEVPLVDRTEEMNVLKEAVYRAVHGEGGLVFIHGEAGIGKTRLVRELGAYAQSRGVKVLYGRCPALFRMDGVPPYVLWKEIIKDYLGECTPEQLNKVIGFYPAEVAKLVPELSQKLRAFPQSIPISPEQEQNRLFEAVSQFITNISNETPLLVVLDDLQWTDPSSLLLLHYLARGVQKTPLLLLGAYRSTDIDAKHPLTPVLAELNRERLPESIQLKRMSLSDISEVIRGSLEQEDVPEDFCKLVYEKTRGNPFFAEEVIKSLKEEDVIYRERNKWEIKDVSKIEFPETVKNVVKARVSRLDEDCQNVLTMASFVGNDFALEALSGVTGIEESKLLEIMDKLLKTGLIKHRVVRGEDLCSFADIIVRDVEYEEAGTFKRKKLHSIVGSTLEKVYAKKIDEHFGELASHFLEGGDKDKALDYFLKAGDKAADIYANSEAASYFQSALKLLEEKEGEPRERARVLERLGDIKRLVGEYETCLKNWAEGLQLWDQLSEKADAARLHRKMANVLWEDVGDTEKAKEHFDKALKILEAGPENVELASLYEDIAHMHYRIGDVPQARSSAERALELAKKLNAYEVIASSYVSLGAALIFGGEEWKKAVECHEIALKIALDKGYMETASRAYNALGVALPAEEWERSIECWEKALGLARKVGAIQLVSMISGNLSWSYLSMGDMDKGVSLLEEMYALVRRTGNIPNLAASIEMLGVVNLRSGEWDKSEQYLKEALSLSQKLNQHGLIAACYEDLGHLYREKEDYAKSREFFEKAYEVLEKAGAKYGQMYGAFFVGWSCVEVGEIEKANNLLNNVCKFAHEIKDKYAIALAEVLKGMICRSQKKWEESIAHFEKSLRECESINARQRFVYQFARFFLFEYARVHLERDQPGDREKACGLLNQALELFQKVGAKKYLEKVEAKLFYIETGKATPVPKPTELVCSGYADLDKLLCGGIPSSCAVVLTSPSCIERDLLVRSFLETGAKKGEVAFFVTINPGPTKILAEEFPSNFYLFVCNPQADAIVKDAPNVVKLKGVENLTDISIALTSAIRQLNPSTNGQRRICLGLVSDVLMQHHAVQTRRWLAGLIPEMESEGFTILAIMDPEMHPSQDARAVLDLFDGEISIYEKETEKGLQKHLKIKKMSDHEYLDEELPLKREDLKILGIKGSLLGKVSQVKPQESKTGHPVFDKHRIAVLPFVNMSPDPNDEYFADGMTEEIISTVSGISGLNVISRTSVMGYKGMTKKVEEIGGELNVGSVLEGSFRKAGNKIRITTQLIDVATDSHLWTQNYDRNLDDIFEVQSDIAKQVADALRVRILFPERKRIEKKPTESVEAHTLYLKGVYHLRQWTASEEERAIEYFKLACEQDPAFALAYARVAECYVLIADVTMPSGEAIPKAKQYVSRALSLDDNLAEAHYAQAMVANQYDWDWAKAEESFRKALSLNPSLADAHNYYAWFLGMMGRSKEAVSEAATACELDPMSPLTLQLSGFVEYIAGEYDRARVHLARMLDLAPASDLAGPHALIAMLNATEGKFEEAIREADEATRLEDDAWQREWQAQVYAMAGSKEKAREILDGLLSKKFPGYLSPTFIGAIYYLLGEKDRGWEWMEKAYEARDTVLAMHNRNPAMKAAMEDLRYLGLLKKLGLG